MKDVMIDIETMGTRSTSMIVQIGACYFDRSDGEIGETFKQNIIHSSDDFTIDQTTINWWLGQTFEARASITENAKDITSVLTELQEFLSEAHYLWSHATFDVPIILNAFQKENLKFPIHYTKMRDIRTLMDIYGKKAKITREGTHHDALDDCKFQVAYCVEALDSFA